MGNNLKLARQQAHLQLLDICARLNITKTTLISWEKGVTYPASNYLLELASIYKTSIDYLLGNDCFAELIDTSTISDINLLYLLHGRPVFSEKNGWLIVNSAEKAFIDVRGEKIPFDEKVMPVQIIKPEEEKVRLNGLLTYNEIARYKEVLVEPIGVDREKLSQLRGYYYVYSEFHFVENDKGNRFFFDNYGIDWLAFKI